MFCKVLHFFCVAVNAKEYKVFISVNSPFTFLIIPRSIIIPSIIIKSIEDFVFSNAFFSAKSLIFQAVINFCQIIFHGFIINILKQQFGGDFIIIFFEVIFIYDFADYIFNVLVIFC